MLPKSLSRVMQCFAELCISSQFACAEMTSTVCQKFPIMTGLPRVECERTVDIIHARTSEKGCQK